MVTATRRLQFCAGHRVYQHESKCANLHGHNYVVHLTALFPRMEGGLDSIGRVIDFSVLKTRFGEWIEKHWDHGFIIAHNDPLSVLWHGDGALGTHKHFFAPFNPTAENMARYLLDSIGPMVLQDLEAVLIKVVLEETENCSAEVTIDEDLRRREADAARARLVGSPTA